MQALWILVHPRGSLNPLFLPVCQGFVQLWFTIVISSFPQQARNLKHVK